MTRPSSSPNDPILVASDLSARSDRPVERALQLAQQRSAPAYLLHVLPESAADGEEQQDRLRRLVSGDLGERADAFEILFAAGSVPSTIARVAEEKGCGLIVTGVARFNSPVDFVLGTAVDYLVRHATVPVLVVKRRPRGPYRRLLVAVDFSDSSRPAIEAAAALFPDAELVVVHACHAAFEAWLDKEETEREACEAAEEEMRGLLGSLPEALRRRIVARVEVGELQDVVERGTIEEGGGLLVLGTHGRSGFAHAAIGSRASELLQAAATDVLMVRPAAA